MKKLLSPFSIAIICLFLFFCSSNAFAAGRDFSKWDRMTGKIGDRVFHGERDSKIAPDLKDLLSNSPPDAILDVIVQTYGKVDNAELRYVKQKKGIVLSVFECVNGYAASIPAGILPSFALREEIKRISPDRIISLLNQVSLGATNADLVERDFGFTGKGVTVAVLDSGIDPEHPDLKYSPGGVEGRIKAVVDMTGRDSKGRDDFGHGTHVSGTILGSGYSALSEAGFPYGRGIAPEADLVSVKVAGEDGLGYTSDASRE